MAIEIDGKVYRNLQQQVEKNMDDIQEIKEAMPYPSYEYSKKLYKHDIMLLLVDSEDSYATAHIIIIDQYNEEYDYSKVKADWRGDIRPISYHRKQGASTLANENTKVYTSFYLDEDEIWFEENETFYSGEAVVTESVNSYKVIDVNDTVEEL